MHLFDMRPRVRLQRLCQIQDAAIAQQKNYSMD